MNVRFFRISKMQKILATLLVVLVMGFSLGAADGAFTILSLNDTHSHLLPWYDSVKQREYGGAARWATVIAETKAEVKDVLVLHAGDFLTGSDSNYLIEHSPDWDRIQTYGYRGLVDIPVMNMIGIDAVCIGNHEFDFGLPWLMRILQQAEFKVLSANLDILPVPKSDEYAKANMIQPNAIFNRDGISIAVIGLTTDEYNKSSQVRIKDPVEAVRTSIKDIGDKASVFVVLSHLGYEKDIELAQAVPEIDIVVGGHSHTKLWQPTYVGKTAIIQTGAYGESLGRLDVVVKNSEVSDISYRLVPSEFSLSEDKRVAQFISNSLSTGKLESPLESNLEELSTMGSFVSEELRKSLDTDYALFTSKFALGRLDVGEVSVKDFFSVFWPYRMRNLGPNKDMTPGQVIDILHGNAPRLARKLLYISEGLTNVMRVTVPFSVLEEITIYNSSLVGTDSYLQISENTSGGKKSIVSLAMDLQAYRTLYEEGILTKTMPYNVYGKELFDIMFKSIMGREIQLPSPL